MNKNGLRSSAEAARDPTAHLLTNVLLERPRRVIPETYPGTDHMRIILWAVVFFATLGAVFGCWGIVSMHQLHALGDVHVAGLSPWMFDELLGGCLALGTSAAALALLTQGMAFTPVPGTGVAWGKPTH